jgi:filamentous hemagglutinin
VNESRVMSFMGGNIAVWSETGDINAGRGSKTMISASPAKLVDMGDGTFQLQFSPPSVGSGIRALTFDPDGASGSAVAPPPGDIYLWARHTVDAGEAGIAGGRVKVIAPNVVNAANISASNGSVGVPSASDGSVSLGALSGAGTVAENSKMIDQGSALGSSQERLTKQVSAVDDFLSKWLDLRIVSFDE